MRTVRPSTSGMVTLWASPLTIYATWKFFPTATCVLALTSTFRSSAKVATEAIRQTASVRILVKVILKTLYSIPQK